MYINLSDLLPTYLSDHHMLDKGLNYSLMAVFGPQSSGKSTLLNALFETRFTTMNMVHGRYQVTKGVCVSKAKNHDLLVMDLEGTDSKERGEENVVSRTSSIRVYESNLTHTVIIVIREEDFIVCVGHQ